MDQLPWPYRLAEWLEDYWNEVAHGVVDLLIILAALLFSDEGAKLVSAKHFGAVQVVAIICVLLLAVCQVWLLIGSCKHKDRLSALRKENAAVKSARTIRALDAKPLIFSYLKMIAAGPELDFGAKNGESERLTLYLHDEGRSAFYAFCRYSNSAELTKVPRQDYPNTEGCLGKVWKQGYHYDCYPSPASADYVSRAEKDNVPRERLGTMRMKPRIYAGTVVWNAENTKHVGVLMLEATSDRYHASSIAALLKKLERGHLGVLIGAMG